MKRNGFQMKKPAKSCGYQNFLNIERLGIDHMGLQWPRLVAKTGEWSCGKTSGNLYNHAFSPWFNEMERSFCWKGWHEHFICLVLFRGAYSWYLYWWNVFDLCLDNIIYLGTERALKQNLDEQNWKPLFRIHVVCTRGFSWRRYPVRIPTK